MWTTDNDLDLNESSPFLEKIFNCCCQFGLHRIDSKSKQSLLIDRNFKITKPCFTI